MKTVIPIITEPYEDEIFFSWICRLAHRNEMSIKMFVREYFNCDIHSNKPIEMCEGFYTFFNALQIDKDWRELCLSLTTETLTTLKTPIRRQTKYFNQYFYPNNELNISQTRYVHSARMCEKCIEEEKEKYGEFYVHRAHQLPFATICHKHHVPLIECATSHKEDIPNIYQFEKYGKIKIKNWEYALKKMEYVYRLFYSGVHSNAETVRPIMLDAIRNQYKDNEIVREALNLPKDAFLIQEFLLDVKQRLNVDVTRYAFETFSSYVGLDDFVLMLMYLYPDVDSLIEKLRTEEELLIKCYCEKCDRYYYLTPQAHRDGWMCPECMENASEDDIYKQLVGTIHQGEYEFRKTIPTPIKQISIYHKVCGEENWYEPQDFLFRNHGCDCWHRM